MNPSTTEEAKRIFAAIKTAAKKLNYTDAVMCPPFPYISLFKNSDVIALGAQDLFWEERGSFTGEVSADMIKAVGGKYAIIGHSERRKLAETDEMVSLKAAAAIKAELTAIVCIGEKIRDEQGEYLGFLRDQIKNSLTKLQKKQLSHLIVAYEPVWAIGAVEAMAPQDVHEMTIFIKKTLSDIFGQEEALKVPILYGGSVTFRNARDIMVLGEVDGFLVGRESVNPPGFVEILKVVDEI